MKLLEDILKEKCEKEDTEILLAQWKYDKELYKDILQNTKDYYCHYTDHGINHSEAVLSNIVRILGIDKIKELSSLDIWLLLEAAYIHDSGMFITRKEVEELCSSKDFLNYFDCLKLNSSSDLYEYTSYFEISNNKLVMLKNEYNLKAEYGLKFIIAEYNRSKHSKRAKGIVSNFNKFKKENTLIPKRITDIAFLIAEAHGKTFEEVMKIHKVETGLKLEKGHPRFIACMLRLGDLLDMDNNRFSKTILKNIEDIMPQKSKNHLEKHKSIAHYRVDSDLIEITAKIENYEDQTYDIVSEVSDWFEFLKKEHNLQVLNWGEIKPANFLGLLPRLGDIKIDVKDYEFIDNMNKPKFTVDTNNVLTILKGSGIYRNEFKALREIVQNSVDAIFLKVYNLNHEKISQDIEAKKDYNELKKKYLENEEIQIEINTQNEEKLEIIIKDTGIGIDKDDLKYLISAGSSPNNYEKKVLIKKMPFWLRPSGNFGIGFQSIFMLTDEVNIKSKKDNLEAGIEVDLFSPSYKGNKKGKIFIKKWDMSYSKYKTKLKFVYSYPKNNLGDALTWEDRVQSAVPSYIIHELERIIRYFPIRINLKINRKEEVTNENYLNQEIYKTIYLKNFGLEIFFVKADSKLDNTFNTSKFFYKNQKISVPSRVKFLNVGINFLEDEANELLEINRDKIKENILSSKKFKSRIICSIFEWIRIKNKEIMDDNDLKLSVSIFINYYYVYYKEFINLNLNCDINQDIIEFFKNNDIYKSLELENEIVIKYEDCLEKIKLNKAKKEFFVNSNNIKDYRLKAELYFYIEYLLKKYYYKLYLRDDEIYLKKVQTMEEEEIIEEIEQKIEEEKYILIRNKIYFDYVNLEIKELKINLDLLNNNYRLDIRQLTERYKINNENLFDSLLLNIKKRNMCLFPLRYVNKNNWIYNKEMEKRYIEICFKYNMNRNITKKEIKEKLDFYVDKLSKKYKIYSSIFEIKEEKKVKENKNTEKIEKILEIFPEIKLEDGGIDFDMLKQLIENRN